MSSIIGYFLVWLLCILSFLLVLEIKTEGGVVIETLLEGLFGIPLFKGLMLLLSYFGLPELLELGIKSP